MNVKMTDDAIREIALPDYPPTLRNMDKPPKKLYMRGCFPATRDHRYLCIVGSRSWTSYGRDAVNGIVSGLRGYPISIVSGLAIGIDSISHAAALAAGLHCVAFPGSSLEWDKVYPPSSRSLARKIVDSGGALLSQWSAEYPMGTWAFPSRNVLMAGLSHATLVVEAGRRSGSLMTAGHALDFGREVLAVPGHIGASQSYGPHMLIKRGAVLVSSSEDVLAALGLEARDRADEGDKGGAPKPQKKGLDELAASILKIIALEDTTTDRLLQKLRIRPAALNEKLTLLEIEGLIKIEDGTLKIA